MPKKPYLSDIRRIPNSPQIMDNAPEKGVFSIKGQSGDNPGIFRFMAKSYKLAKGYRGKSGKVSEKWFAYYSFIHPYSGSFKRIRVYEGINYIKVLSEKEVYLCELIQEIDKHLRLGYNPFKYNEPNKRFISEIEYKEITKMPLLTEGFEMFVENKKKKNLARQTIQAYESFILQFNNYLIDTKKADMRLSDLTIKEIEDMLNYIQHENKFGETRYNNYLGFWRTLINWFSAKPRYWVRKEDFNIGEEGDLEMRITRPMKHQYFGESVLKNVKEALIKNPVLNFYAQFIYYSCMRPDEIRQLKIENIDLSGRFIKIVGKTKSRVIPVCAELAEMIGYIKDYPTNFYVIGKDGKCCSEQHGEGFYARLFRDIRSNLNLSDNFTLYGFKHTRVLHLLNAGYSDAEVMNITGHRDTASFDKYKRDLMGNIKTRLREETIRF